MKELKDFGRSLQEPKRSALLTSREEALEKCKESKGVQREVWSLDDNDGEVFVRLPEQHLPPHA